jgi:cell division protease FtsH
MKQPRRSMNASTPSLGEAVAECVLKAALRHYLRRKHLAFVAVVVVPDKANIESYREAAENLLRTSNFFENINNTQVQMIKDADEKRATVVVNLVDSFQRAIVLVSSENAVTEQLRLAADFVVNVAPPSPRHFLSATRRLGLQGLTAQDAEYLATLDLGKVSFAIRRGRPLRNGIRRLLYTQQRESDGARSNCETGLETLAGYGEVRDWGMQLAADFAAWKDGRINWQDVDRGALISGPPGCGKTTFAAALAMTCNVELVAASAAAWQSHGHLGDYLKAMRATFAEARSKAPCVLFLDEFDSFGDRSSNTDDHNIDYKRQAINGLLEAIDGSNKLEGVVLVGATNYPDEIDPALLRPGRLERHLRVPMPNEEARMTILQKHLGGVMPEGDMTTFLAATENQTGAFIELIAKDARRRARTRRAAIQIDDINAVLPAKMSLGLNDLARLATHEAGHAIVGILLDVDNLVEVKIRDYIIHGAGVQSPGVTVFVPNKRLFRTAAHYLDQICMMLAGTAAEEIVFGDRSDGSGGSENSDLAMASEIAAKLESRLGLGRRLAVTVSQKRQSFDDLAWCDNRLRGDIETVLQGQMERARALLQDHRHQLDHLVEMLVAKLHVDGNVVRQIVLDGMHIADVIDP